MIIAPEETPANERTAASFSDIVDVPEPPFSSAIDWPAVVPPRLIGPEELRAMFNP
jgi:hypothetical protein